MDSRQAETPVDPQLSLIVPMHNEEGNVRPLLEEIRQAVDPLDVVYEVILVDDGSHDATWEVIQQAADQDQRVLGISLSRNFGHQNAIFAGLHFCRGQAVITMDGDLQHPPTLIPELVRAWRQGNRIVETQRIESADVSAFKATTSRLFYRIFSYLSGMPISKGTSDFRLVDRQVAEIIRSMRDADLFLRGITHWVGFRRTSLPYQANPRHSGQTKYSLRRMIRFATSSLLSFSVVPLRMGIWLGLLTSFLAFMEMIYIGIRWIQGAVVPGWASTLTVVSFMFGILFVLVGVLGAYLGSIFETLKDRPRFLVQETTRPPRS